MEPPSCFRGEPPAPLAQLQHAMALYQPEPASNERLDCTLLKAADVGLCG